MDAADMARTLDRLARQVVEELDEAALPAERLGLVGMQTRGVHLARRLRDRIERFEGVRLPFGVLDATFYRDDVGGFGRRHAAPLAQPTDIPFDLDDRRLVLVDDVVYTGRTTRAALDALMDMGRPASVRLLAFIDRGLRELPVAPDFVGRTVPTAPGELVRVRLAEQDGEDGVWLVSKHPA
jgi:pyrimidine operon attenuation protein/uracil phosphoribosyltransferase